MVSFNSFLTESINGLFVNYEVNPNIKLQSSSINTLLVQLRIPTFIYKLIVLRLSY